MRIASVLELFSDLSEPELVLWVERGWVRPVDEPSGWVFQEIDVARIHLIRDLRQAMLVADDMVPLILALLDQVYDLRGQLRSVSRAIEAQPHEIRSVILKAIEVFPPTPRGNGENG